MAIPVTFTMTTVQRVFSVSKVILSTRIRDLLEMPSNWSRLYVQIESLPRHITNYKW